MSREVGVIILGTAKSQEYREKLASILTTQQVGTVYNETFGYMDHIKFLYGSYRLIAVICPDDPKSDIDRIISFVNGAVLKDRIIPLYTDSSVEELSDVLKLRMIFGMTIPFDRLLIEEPQVQRLVRALQAAYSSE